MEWGSGEALRRREERLRHAEERLRLMEESVKDHAILSTDTQGVVTFWSKGAERMFGYAEHEILGRPAAVLFTSEDRYIFDPDGRFTYANASLLAIWRKAWTRSWAGTTSTSATRPRRRHSIKERSGRSSTPSNPRGPRRPSRATWERGSTSTSTCRSWGLEGWSRRSSARPVTSPSGSGMNKSCGLHGNSSPRRSTHWPPTSPCSTRTASSSW